MQNMDLNINLKFEPRLPSDRLLRTLGEVEAKKVLLEALHDGFVAMLQRIPVATGMAVGSLLPVARLVKAMDIYNAKLSERTRSENRIKDGQALGEPKSGKIIKRTKDAFLIQFSTKVIHFIFNDIMIRPDFKRPQIAPPWEAFTAAEEAIILSIEVNIRRELLSLIRLFEERNL
jgi:hypothetical protein